MAPTSPARARWQATLACCGAGLLWWRTQSMASVVLVAIAAMLATLAWCSPRGYAPVQRGLDAVTRALLAAVSWTVLALVFFGLFTPLAWLRRLAGKPPFITRKGPPQESYLVPLASSATGRFDRQF